MYANNWTVKLYPMDLNLPAVVRTEKVVSFHVQDSLDSKFGRRKKYVTFEFEKGKGHITVLFDTTLNPNQTVYFRFELFNSNGNMVRAFSNLFDSPYTNKKYRDAILSGKMHW